VFGDKVLQDMARVRPTTLETFQEIEGVESQKVTDYGIIFTAAIAAFCEASEMEMDMKQIPNSQVSQLSQVSQMSNVKDFRAKDNNNKMTDSKYCVWKLFQVEKKSLQETASTREIQVSTVQGYLADCMMLGYPVDWDRLQVKDGAFNVIKKTLESGIPGSDKDLKMHMPDEISYGEIKLVRAKLNAPPLVDNLPVFIPLKNSNSITKSSSQLASQLLNGSVTTKRKSDVLSQQIPTSAKKWQFPFPTSKQ